MAFVFSRQKRIQRDLDAGLVFRWRGGNGGNSGGMVIAVVLSVVMMAALFLVLEVSFKQSPPKKNTYAKILMLDEVSPELALWVDQHSPFPVRWDPAQHPELEARVLGYLDTTLLSLNEPQAHWLEMPQGAHEMTQMRLLEPRVTELGPLPVIEEPQAKQQIIELSLDLRAFNGMAKRLPEELTTFSEKIPVDQFGAEIHFAVVVNPAGSVVQCAPVEWSDDDFTDHLVRWLSQQQFQETQGSQLAVGDVTVKVKVINHVRNQL